MNSQDRDYCILCPAPINLPGLETCNSKTNKEILLFLPNTLQGSSGELRFKDWWTLSYGKSKRMGVFLSKNVKKGKQKEKIHPTIQVLTAP